MEVLEKVKDIIVEQLSAKKDELTMETSFIEDLGADSLDVVQLIMAFEEGFDIEIPEEDAEGITSVGDVVEYINQHVK